MKTVAFYSYKGGVGRSLLVAHTARLLANRGKRVVALDLDFEAPGLHEKLCTPETLDGVQAGTDAMRGAVDLLHLIQQGNTATASKLGDFSIDIPVDDGSKGRLTLIPAGAAPWPRYWVALANLQSKLRTSPPGEGLAQALLELQAQIAQELKPDFLLIDSRTGVTELGGLATSLLADDVVCMTTDSLESIRGTGVVARALQESARLSTQKPLNVEVILTRANQDWYSTRSDLSDFFDNKLTVFQHDSELDSCHENPEGDHQTGIRRAMLVWAEKTFIAN